MALITSSDILDNTLSGLVLPADLDAADEAFYDICNDLGAYRTQVKTDPLPYKLKRYLQMWICCEVCKREVGKNQFQLSSGAVTDWYKEKLKIYETELGKATEKLTYNIVCGINVEVDDNSNETGLIERG